MSALSQQLEQGDFFWPPVAISVRGGNFADLSFFEGGKRRGKKRVCRGKGVRETTIATVRRGGWGVWSSEMSFSFPLVPPPLADRIVQYNFPWV